MKQYLSMRQFYATFHGKNGSYIDVKYTISINPHFVSLYYWAGIRDGMFCLSNLFEDQTKQTYAALAAKQYR
jgi:hypothetical protein